MKSELLINSVLNEKTIKLFEDGQFDLGLVFIIIERVIACRGYLA